MSSLGSTLFRSWVYIRFLVAFLIIPNTPFWIGAHLFDIYPRGRFNVEYLGTGVAALFLPTFVWCPIAVLLLLADVFHASTSFYFFSQHDLLDSARYSLQVPHVRIFEFAVTLLAFTFLVVFTMNIVMPRTVNREGRKVAGFSLLLAMVLLSVDIANGSNGFFRFRDSTADFKLASAPAISLLKTAIIVLSGAETPNFQPVSSATQALTAIPGRDHFQIVGRTGIRNDVNVVLVIVESLGQFRDDKLNEPFFQPFLSPDITSRYEVSFGLVPFQGPTVSGEFRELCGVQAGVREHPDTSFLLSHCLPRIFADHGYRTTAIHGYNTFMFDRSEWYPNVGFQSFLFREQMRDEGYRECDGPFPGICDQEISPLLERMLASRQHSSPDFIYWLTLQSHLPVVRSTEECKRPSDPNEPPDVCEWAVIVRNTLSSIAKVASAANIRPSEFMIVGDHAPPFMFESYRRMFIPGEVPFIHLIPQSHVGDRRVTNQRRITTWNKAKALKTAPVRD